MEGMRREIEVERRGDRWRERFFFFVGFVLFYVVCTGRLFFFIRSFLGFGKGWR